MSIDDSTQEILMVSDVEREEDKERMKLEFKRKKEVDKDWFGLQHLGDLSLTLRIAKQEIRIVKQINMLQQKDLIQIIIVYQMSYRFWS